MSRTRWRGGKRREEKEKEIGGKKKEKRRIRSVLSVGERESESEGVLLDVWREIRNCVGNTLCFRSQAVRRLSI